MQTAIFPARFAFGMAQRRHGALGPSCVPLSDTCVYFNLPPGSRVGVAVSSLSFRIVFALRMVTFLYRGVPTILFIWLLPTFSRSTRQTTAQACT